MKKLQDNPSRAAVSPDDELGRGRFCVGMRRRCWGLAALLLLLSNWLLLNGFSAGPAASLVRADEQTEDDPSEGSDAQQLFSDRRAIQQAQLLRQQTSGGQTAGVDELISLLSQLDARYMVPVEPPLWEPLYRVVFRCFHELPGPQQERIRESYSTLADAEFDRVLREPQTDSLIQLIHRFPGSEASYKAHLIIARQHVDVGHSLAAMHWILPLTDAGIPGPWRERAERLLAQLKTATAATAPGTADVADDRDHRPVAEVDVQRAPSSAEAPTDDRILPRFTRWTYEPPLASVTQETLARFIHSAHQLNLIPWSNWRPAVDQHRVYLRTLRGVTAVRLTDGRPDWGWSSTSSSDSSSRSAGRNYEDAPVPPGASAEHLFSSLERSNAVSLLMRNAVTGRMTADALRLYLILDEWGPRNGGMSGALFQRNMRQQIPEIAPSMLVALDKESGRRLWTAGGEPVEANFQNDLTQAWIAGPPVLDQQRLYAVFEQRDAISLACLDAETGSLHWRIPLTWPLTGIARDMARRTQAAETAVRGGLIWTTTTTGWLMAADQQTRSILWATSAGSNRGSGSTRGSRGGELVMSEMLSIRTSWPTHPPVLAGTHLTVLPGSNQNLVILNALTGQVERERYLGDQGMVLHADQDRIVVARRSTIGSAAIEAVSAHDGETLWEFSLQEHSFRPCGTGVLQGNQLIVPMSDGELYAFRMADGTIAEHRSTLNSDPAWDGLLSADSQIAAYQPGRIMLLSSAAAEPVRSGKLEQVQQLLAEGRGTEGLEILNLLTGEVAVDRQIRELRFRCLASILMHEGFSHANPVARPPLDELQALAESEEQQALVLQLQISAVLASGNRNESSAALLKLLQSGTELLNIPVEHLPSDVAQPTPANRADQPAAGNHVRSSQVVRTGVVRLPLRTWLLMHLRRLLEETSEQPGILQAQLAQLPESVLLQLQHPAAHPLLLERARQKLDSGEASELVLQLMLEAHGVSLMQQMRDQIAAGRDRTDRLSLTGGESSAPAGSAESKADGIDGGRPAPVPSAADSGTEASPAEDAPGDRPWTRIRKRLLDELVAETRDRESVEGSHADDAGAAVMDQRADRADQLRQRICAGWRNWPLGDYAVIPVTQSVPYRHVEFSIPSLDASDPFINSYEWQISRTAPFLKAYDLLEQPSRVWSVAGQFANAGAWTGVMDQVGRVGSIVIIQSAQGLFGFSILDQRMVWNRLMPDGPRNVSPPRSGQQLQFQEFSVADRQRLGHFFPGHYAVSGSAARWICLQHKSRIEVFDSLSGETRWWLDDVEDGTVAFAAGQVVVTVGSQSDHVTAFRLSDGVSVPCGLSVDDLRQTLTTTPDAVVVITAENSALRSYRLDWKDPLTGTSLASVELADIQAFQFVNAQTLLAIGRAGFQEIHLQTRTVRRFEWPPSEIVPLISSDPMYYYLYSPPPEDQEVVPGGLLGRSLMPFSGPLRAIDRETGELQWTQETGPLVRATFDQPMSPVLLLIFGDARLAANNGAQAGFAGMAFRGILKSTGQQLFEHRLSSRFPIPLVRLQTNAEHQIDVEAFGSRVRFLPPVIPDARPEGAVP